MKARSCALEISIAMSLEDLSKLKSSCLEGVLDFEDFFSEPNIRRGIPFKITYDHGQKNLLSVIHEPKEAYFGEANEVEFSINQEYYEELWSYGEFSERFYTGGKLLIRIDPNQKAQ